MASFTKIAPHRALSLSLGLLAVGCVAPPADDARTGVVAQADAPVTSPSCCDVDDHPPSGYLAGGGYPSVYGGYPGGYTPYGGSYPGYAGGYPGGWGAPGGWGYGSPGSGWGYGSPGGYGSWGGWGYRGAWYPPYGGGWGYGNPPPLAQNNGCPCDDGAGGGAPDHH